MEHNDTSAPQPERMNGAERKRRQLQRKRLRLMIDISAVVLVVLLAVLLIMQAGGQDELAGTWRDSETIIEFNGKGKGVWYRGDDVEKFTYKIQSDTVRLDFKRDNVQDLTYTFSLEDEHLELTDGAGEHMSMHLIQ